MTGINSWFLSTEKEAGETKIIKKFAYKPARWFGDPLKRDLSTNLER